MPRAKKVYLVEDRTYIGLEVAMMIDSAVKDARKQVGDEIREKINSLSALRIAHVDALVSFYTELTYIFTATATGTIANSDPAISKMLTMRGGELAKRFHDFQEVGRRYGGEELDEWSPIVAQIVEAVKSAGAGDCERIKWVVETHGNALLETLKEVMSRRDDLPKRGAPRKSDDWLTVQYEDLIADGQSPGEAVAEIKHYLETKSPPLTAQEQQALADLKSTDPVGLLQARVKRKNHRQNDSVGDKMILSAKNTPE